MSLRLLIAIAVLSVFGLLGWWFLENFDYVEENVRVRMSGEAARNPYLAAERTLNILGLRAQTLKRWEPERALADRGVLILPEQRDALGRRGVQRILQWVEAGGHLITEDRALEDSDPLLDALEVSRSEGKRGEKPAVKLQLPDDERIYSVKMHALQSLDTEREAWYVDSEFATHMLHFRHGRGYVTVLNDLEFMRNTSLDEDDHADFLFELARLHKSSGALTFYHSQDEFSLWDWLSTHARAVLLAGAAMLLLWLWRVAPRFGPLAAENSRARRSLLEHLRASGRFLWSVGASDRLLEAAREQALRKLKRAHPELLGLNEVQLRARLQQLFDLEARELVWLTQTRKTKRGETLQALQLFQRMHAQLAFKTRIDSPKEKA